MSSPIVWIIFPMIVAVIGFIFRRWKSTVTITLTLVTMFLTLFALLVPIGEQISLGPWAITIADRLTFVGREFVLEDSDRPMLVVIYLTLAFFFFGSLSSRVSKFFVPLGLAMASMLIASLSVRPFLYAALLIEVAVLIGVPLLSPPGKPVERGVLRYVSFLSIGFPFMLIGSGLLSSVVVDLTRLDNLIPALVILGLGFAFLLAIFPLNTWIPLLLEWTQPYPSTFVLSVLPMVVIALLFRFMYQLPWLLDTGIILFIGTLMVISGGLWAAFQRDLGRMIGYAVIIQIGYSLLAISQPDGTPIYFAMFLPRILALGVWALALSLIKEQVGDLKFRSVQGLGRQIPLVALGVLIGHFSLAGFPLLASFPLMLALWGQLVNTSWIVALLVLLGSIGLLVGALRSLAVFVMGPEQMHPQKYNINRVTQTLLLLGSIAIIMAGLFPQIYLGWMTGIIGLK